MDGGNQWSMDGGNDESHGGSDYWGEDKGLTKEAVIQIMRDENDTHPFGSRMIPELPKEKFTEEISDYLQNSGDWLNNISHSVRDVLIRSGLKDANGVEDIVKNMQSLLRAELDAKMLIEAAQLREEMKPIFDMLADPQLALSARVKAFELKG